MEYLDLGQNGLTGSIPTEIGNLESLTFLSLAHNQLTGSIPPEVGNAKRLKQLWVDANPRLSGLMPRSLLSLNLVQLNTESTELCAPLDPGFREWLQGIQSARANECEVGVVERLALVELFNTTGGETWKNAEGWNTDADLESWHGVTVEGGRVRSLLLADNGLTGSFPAVIVTLAELEQLDLSTNDLTGDLPADIGYLSSLTKLLLTGNAALDGQLPFSMTRLTRLNVLQYLGTGLCLPPTRGFETWVAGGGLDVAGPVCTNVQSVALEFPMVYLVQAIQNPGQPVPLVANRDALLRVFLTAPTLHGFTAPAVLVTFQRDGEQVYRFRIEAPNAELPVQVDQGNLRGSYNAVVPAEHIQPGLEFFVEADPDSSLLVADDAEDRYPAVGSIRLEVVPAPALELTVVPVLNAAEPDSSIFEQIADLTEDSHVVSLLRWAFPLSAFEVRTRDTYVTSLDLTSSDGISRLLSELAAIRSSESGTGHYYGTALSKTGVVRGLGLLSGWISAGKPLASDLAHEVGHNLGLRHAPCGGASGIDPNFPYGDGKIGVWGYDFREGVPVSPDARDIMGYCPAHAWLSDYHYEEVLAHRARGFPARSGGSRSVSRRTKTSLATSTSSSPFPCNRAKSTGSYFADRRVKWSSMSTMHGRSPSFEMNPGWSGACCAIGKAISPGV